MNGKSWNFAGTAGTILLAAAVSDFYVSQTREGWNVSQSFKSCFTSSADGCSLRVSFWRKNFHPSTCSRNFANIHLWRMFNLDQSKCTYFYLKNLSRVPSSPICWSTLRPEVEMATEKIQSRVWKPYPWRIIPFSKWLITMVSKSPNWGCSLYKWPKWLINGGY